MATTLLVVTLALVSTTFGSICKPDEFQCTHPDDGCIPYEDSCNGWIDCMRDGSDESEDECGTSMKWARHHRQGYKFCNDGIHAIREEKFCDGSNKDGCRDESDEYASFCEGYYFTGCPSGRFRCAMENLCISNELVCDGKFHCSQNLTDEDFDVCDKWKCAKGFVKISGCEDDELQCYNNGMCFPQSYRCDGFADCPLNWDESEQLCSTNWVQSNGYCYQETLVCNGFKDLDNGADEANCSDWTCADGYQKCADNLQCILEREICNLEYDCYDQSDEIGCENYTCPANTWKCKYSHKCIDEEDVCNEYEGETLLSGDCCDWGDIWCEDRSDEDEEMCRNYTCLSGFRKTRSHKCIREHFVCDGIIDSEDGSDEENCEAHTCAEGYVKCGDLKTCIEEQNVCGKTLPEYKRKYTYLGTYDEEPNCSDGSDELCGDHCVPDDFTGRFTFKKCSEEDSVCIPLFCYCDGKMDCPKGSDERNCTCEQLNMVNCQSVDNMATCMPVSWICNKHPSCTNNDKKICSAPPEEEKCTSDQFWCHFQEDPEKQCLALSKKCDNVTDCFGGER